MLPVLQLVSVKYPSVIYEHEHILFKKNKNQSFFEMNIFWTHVNITN